MRIFDIQHFSLHDGPGIRSVVFMKGCPIRCQWCHNPESQESAKEMFFWSNKCLNCGLCTDVCPVKAHTFHKEQHRFNRSLCVLCGKCTHFCPEHALEVVGYDITASEIMSRLVPQKLFYFESNGGVTFSGGEPFEQAGELAKILAMCKQERIHTAIETSGFTTEQNLKFVVDSVDLVLFDIKAIDLVSHKQFTGYENKRILSNIERLFSIYYGEVWIRIPVIPEFNDKESEMRRIAYWIADNLMSHRNARLTRVELLPFHNVGESKYEALGRKYLYKHVEPPVKDVLEKYSLIFKEAGIPL